MGRRNGVGLQTVRVTRPLARLPKLNLYRISRCIIQVLSIATSWR